MLVIFENFSQLVELVGNRFNRLCWAAPVLETHQIVLVGSHSFGLGIERLFFLLESLLFEDFVTEF